MFSRSVLRAAAGSRQVLRPAVSKPNSFNATVAFIARPGSAAMTARFSGCPMHKIEGASAESLSPRPTRDAASAVPEQYRHQTLSESQRELIKASIPVLQVHGFNITKTFYHNMLEAHPELNDIFNDANQKHFKQPLALAQALVAYASNIDDLSPLGEAVELMAAKHVSLYVRPEQYAIVGEWLIKAIGQTLGSAVTPELAEAWTAAYWQLAEILIKREDQLYKGAEGWTDWAEFKIARMERESDEVTSFYLEPVSEALRPLPPFLPGQFISIQVDVPTTGHRQARQYTLSRDPDPNFYRISIKRETGENAVERTGEPGLISNLMHDNMKEGDVIRVSHPYGDFYLDSTKNENSPLVLISGGVGLTPIMSIVNSLVAHKSARPVSWIHGSRSASVRPFSDHIRSLAKANDNLRVTFFEDSPGKAEAQGKDYDMRGPIDFGQLDSEKTLFLKDPSAQYFVCGPNALMNMVEKALLKEGVDSSRIHMEKFGTGGVVREPPS